MLQIPHLPNFHLKPLLQRTESLRTIWWSMGLLTLAAYPDRMISPRRGTWDREHVECSSTSSAVYIVEAWREGGTSRRKRLRRGHLYSILNEFNPPVLFNAQLLKLASSHALPKGIPHRDSLALSWSFITLNGEMERTGALCGIGATRFRRRTQLLGWNHRLLPSFLRMPLQCTESHSNTFLLQIIR